MNEHPFVRAASWLLVGAALLAFWYVVYTIVSRLVAGM